MTSGLSKTDGSAYQFFGATVNVGSLLIMSNISQYRVVAVNIRTEEVINSTTIKTVRDCGDLDESAG